MKPRTLGLSQEAQSARLQVAIDGPAGAGKSTVGRGLADALGSPYLDTGLMYRALTRRALLEHIALDDAVTLAQLAGTMQFELAEETRELLISGHLPSPDLHSADVDAAVSQVSAHPAVRAVLVAHQRAMASDHCIVMVGRDIGTVVLPEAPVKLWVTATPGERARRRMLELGPAQPSTLESVLEAMEARDERDAARPIAPLARAPDAHVIDTTDNDPAESVKEALSFTQQTLARMQARPAPSADVNRAMSRRQA